MERARITYLSYITLAETLPSIVERGILSHDLASAVPHTSIANADVQEHREAKILPCGRRLHSFANVYFWARNAMMYARRHVDGLCVVRVSPRVLDIDGVYYTTRNGAAQACEFHKVDGDLANIRYDEIYVRSWSDDDSMQKMQAEVLVPDVIPPAFLDGVYIQSESDRARVRSYAGELDVRLYPGLFFSQ